MSWRLQVRRPRKDVWLDIQNRSRHRSPSAHHLHALTSAILAKEAPKTQGVGLIFVDDREMKRLNLTYRKKNSTTDVLSFPTHLPQGTFPYLGDVVISLSFTRTLAKQAGVSTTRYCSTLLIHGLLHLCGYDHERDQGDMMRRQAYWERRALNSDPLPMGRT